MGRPREQERAVDDLVSCGECGRWVHLDETEFESLAEAEEGSLVCRICERFEVGLKLMEARCEARVEELRRELKAEREQRVALNAKVEELIKREESQVALQELTREWERRVTSVECQLNEAREKRVELESQLEELRKGEAWKAGLEQLKRECEGRVERLTGVVSEGDGKCMEGQERVVELEGTLRTEVEKRVAMESQWEELKREVAGREVAKGRNASEQVEISERLEAPRPYSAVVREGGSQLDEVAPVAVRETSQVDVDRQPQDSQGEEGGRQPEVRRVLVVGDSNVSRIKVGVLTRVKKDERVTVVAQPGKCLVDAMAEAKEFAWGNREGRDLVVVHAGLNDVFRGRSQNLGHQLHVGLRELRGINENVHVVICTIPEVRGQSLQTERRVIEANRIIKEMSRRLNYGVVEINREVYEAGSFPFEQSGIHYSGVTGGRVGDRLGSQATAFLGGPRALRAPA